MGKVEINIRDLQHLRDVVAEMIETGEQPKLQIPVTMLADPATIGVLGAIIDDHPKAKAAPKEITSECEENRFLPQEYNGFAYRIEPEGSHFRMKILNPCGGSMEPWDIDFTSYEDAEDHAFAFIDRSAL
jgi:hypothetical protein